MAKIPKSVRERAALLCQVAASNVDTDNVLDVQISLQPKGDARSLAWDAYIASSRYTTCIDGDVYVYAEAECLLRCDWSPGDPVVRL